MAGLAHYPAHFSNRLTLIEMQVYYSSFFLCIDYHAVSYYFTDSLFKREMRPYHSILDVSLFLRFPANLPIAFLSSTT
jgi:hypothetical protein